MNQEHSNKLNRARVLAMEELQGFAVRTDFWTVFEIAFGRSYDRVRGEELRSQWQLGEVLLPPLEVVSQQTLGTALGAYSISTGKIYLSQQFIVNSSPKDLVRVILEEYGHHVDARGNTLDSPGDEGAIFAALVEGNIPEEAALSQLKVENDSNWISVDGERLLIEQSSPGTVVRIPIAPASPGRTRYEYGNHYAFAALKSDGSVVTWGSSGSGGDSSSVASQLTSGITQIFSNVGAFAALKSDGSVVAWGSSDYGGDSSSVASQLTSGVTQIFSTGAQIFSTGSYSRGAFAALKSDGSVVTWGDSGYGGNSSSVASQLTSGVTQIFSTQGAFAALKSNGSVVTWGDSARGGNSSSVANQLTSGVTQIFSTQGAFAALKSNGSVVTWGDSSWGGDSSSVASQLTSGVSQIFSSYGAFAALKSNGSVVAWGSSYYGGDSSSVASQLTSGVSQIFSTGAAFAALRGDGSVVTWGDSGYGGDSSSVASQLTSGVSQIFSTGFAFAALRGDGSVVTWGDSGYGGNSSSVASQLTSDVSQIFSTAYAFAALKSDGSVVTWGDSGYGGDSSSVATQLTGGVVSFADPFNDDRLVPLTGSSVTLAVSPSTVTEDGTSNLIYTFTRNEVTSNQLTVNYTVGGTATNGTDYGNIGTSVTFAANSSTATVTVDPTADTTVESDETVSLTLASGNGYTLGTTSAVTGTITNDDNTPPVLENLTFTGAEDKILNFVISDNNSPYRDDDNNDLAAVKVVSLPSFGSLTFVNGQPISLNQRVSAVELLNVRYNPNANVNGQDTFNITAIDNGTPEAESAQAKVTINVTPVNDAPEFTLTGNIQAVTGATDQTVTGFAQNISAGPNESSQKFEFITTVTSGNEIFTKLPSIDVTGNLTYSLSKTPGTATVKVVLKDDAGVANSGQDTTEKEFTVQSATNDDTSVTLAVSPSTVIEDGTSNLVYTFTRTGVLSNDLTVNYTVGGTATFNSDYTQREATSFTATAGTITFVAGASTATLVIDPNSDTGTEGNETVTLALASGSGYTIATTSAVNGSILDNDVTPGTIVRTPIAPAAPGRTQYEYLSGFALAALKSDGSVVTWGDSFSGGDSSSVATQLTSGVSQIFSNVFAFAALKSDGSVVTWGDSLYGGNSSSVATQLTSGVSQIFSTARAFAALKSDGSVVTWGDSGYGGDSSSVATQLTSGVSQIFSTARAFAALKSDGSVVTWGDSGYGGNSSSVATQLTSGVSQISSTGFAFAALKSDGSVVTWGDSGYGGNSSSVATQLTSGVSQIFSTYYAFAALKSNGSIVTWGDSLYGGNSSGVATQLTSGVIQIFPSYYAFAALKSDGSVVTWGDSFSGGDSSGVASQLTSGVSQIFSTGYAFAALKSDGSVVTWGDSFSGGDSSSVATQLTSGVSQIFSTGFAFAALKSDGSVVTWGDSFSGGDSSSVATQLTSGVSQIFSNGYAFAALKGDGSVVTWGDSLYGGNSSSAASQLTSGVVSFADPFNDDRLVPLTGSSVTLAVSPPTVTEDGASNLIYNFTRTGVISNELTVNYTVGGTATNGTDYSNIGTSVTFAANSATANVTVDPTADTTVELDETVSLTLASGTGYTIGTTTAVTGTIINDDTNVTLAVSPSTVTEDGSSNLIYTFTRTGVTSNALTVNYTVGGTATNGTDYSTIGTSVTFAANFSTATVTVDPTADTTVESDETVSLTLDSGTGYTLGTTSAVTGTITNDDTNVTLAVSPSTVTEDGTDNLIYTFTRTGVISNDLAVNYTFGGTATNGTDYSNIGTSVTFATNSSTATVTVDPTTDTTVESDETVSLTLASGTGYTIGTTSAVTGTITNDDTNVTLAVSPPTVTEDGSSNLIYTFTRTGVISNALTVNYTVGGNATNGTDYGNIGTSVTFAANSATANVTVDPTADTTVESDETVSLTLASGTGYTIGTTSAVTGIVINDDKINTPPVLENLTFTCVEDEILNFVISDNNSPFRDDDNNDLAAVKVVSLPSFGSLTFVNGQPISLNQRVSAVELLNVRYNPNANVNGQDTFNITAIDNGTPEAESAQAKVTINVTPVNDAPEFTLTGNIQALTGAVDQTVTGFAQNISAGPNESSQKFEFITTVTSGNEIFTKLPSIDVTGNLTYSLSKTPGTATVKVVLKDDGGVANSGQDTTEKEFTVQSAIPLNPSVFEPNVDISAGLTFKPQTNGTVDLDTSRESASLDQVQSVQNGTKSNFNHIIGLYEVMNDQGEIKDNQGNTLKPGDANYALHALTTARVKNFTLQAGGNDTPSTATQLGAGVSVLGGKFYAPFAIANGGTYFPSSQGIEDFVAAEEGKIDRFSTALPYVRELVAIEGKNGDVFNNAPRFVQEPVAYFTFGAANHDKSAHFRSYGNGVYGFEDLPADLTQYSNKDFNDAVFALKLTT